MEPGLTQKAPARRRLFPPRALNQLMTVVAMSGLAMAALSPRAGVTTATPRRFTPPPLIWSPYGPVSPPAQAWAPDARFAVPAPEGLDPRFVVAAPQGIDDRMIANPGGPAVLYEPAPAMPNLLVVPVPPPQAGR